MDLSQAFGGSGNRLGESTEMTEDYYGDTFFLGSGWTQANRWLVDF